MGISTIINNFEEQYSERDEVQDLEDSIQSEQECHQAFFDLEDAMSDADLQTIRVGIDMEFLEGILKVVTEVIKKVKQFITKLWAWVQTLIGSWKSLESKMEKTIDVAKEKGTEDTVTFKANKWHTRKGKISTSEMIIASKEMTQSLKFDGLLKQSDNIMLECAKVMIKRENDQGRAYRTLVTMMGEFRSTWNKLPGTNDQDARILTLPGSKIMYINEIAISDAGSNYAPLLTAFKYAALPTVRFTDSPFKLKAENKTIDAMDVRSMGVILDNYKELHSQFNNFNDLAKAHSKLREETLDTMKDTINKGNGFTNWVDKSILTRLVNGAASTNLHSLLQAYLHCFKVFKAYANVMELSVKS